MSLEQLTTAYRSEKDLYHQILGLVDEQERIMREEANPRRVLKLTRDVEALLEQITAIEESVEDQRADWGGERQQAPPLSLIHI